MNSKEAFYESEIYCMKHSSYFDVYDDALAKYKNKNIIFVEIGVFEGGSLLMWRNFFGPKARIIGVDINPNAKEMEKKGFEVFIGDQTSQKFWESFFKQVGDVDVILDDGGHYFDQQIVTLEMGIKHLRDGGLILIEDTHTSYMKSYFGPNMFSFVNYAKNLVDQINFRSGMVNKKRYNNSLFSIKFYESIVIFEKNSIEHQQKSFMLDNKKQNYISTFDSKKSLSPSKLKEKLKSVNLIIIMFRIFVQLKAKPIRFFNKALKSIKYKKLFKNID